MVKHGLVTGIVYNLYIYVLSLFLIHGTELRDQYIIVKDSMTELL